MPKPTFRKKSVDDDNSISKFSDEKISVGDIRKTQVITTFGVGSIVDFKDDTVIIASTDDWDYPPDSEEVEKRKIFNENLSVITEAEYFLMPKTTQNTNHFFKGKNITSYVFPEKLHCSRCGNLYDFRELNIKDRHRCPQCKNILNASRFIVVCTRGHMDDFPYDWWVHYGKPCPSGVKSPRIKMLNIYNRTDIDSLRLECTECKSTRSMVQVFSENALSEFRCTCKHPHFKNPYARVQYGCNDKMRARLRSASGVYFPITKAALLIPPIREKIYSEINDKDEVKMCGVLIFVSSSDSDSSLGGLISIADNKDIFEKIMDSMLDRASWCSGDPLCISSMKQGYKNLNYAACHDCTLLPETSCERFNCFLDRASIVGLPDNPALGFFNT